MKPVILIRGAIITIAVLLAGCAAQADRQRVVLPLDHGPRAETTPWANKQRLNNIEKTAQSKQAQSPFTR
jgi:hypothetical protein